MIPRKGQRWVVMRGKTKKRAVVVVIAGIYRRNPAAWLTGRNDGRERYWHEIFYRTEGTWAGHGERNATARAFLRLAKPAGATP